MLVEILVLVLTIYILLRYVSFKTKYAALTRKYNTPKGYPIIGHSLSFLNPRNFLPGLSQMSNEAGSVFNLQLGFDRYLNITDPKFMEFICTNNAFNTKGIDYRFLYNWFGTGLLTAAGDKWRQHRKILTPSFHYTILEEFVHVFNKSSDIFIDKLKTLENLDNVNIYDHVTLLTLDIIHDTAMGTSVRAQIDPDSKYVQSIRDMCDVIFRRVFSLYGRFNFLYKFSTLREQEQNALNIIHDHSNKIIINRKEILDKASEDQDDENDLGIKKKFTFLDVLLRCRINEKPIPIKDIREEVDTFMFEGHDTTAVAISFILYAISNHVDIQKKICNELETIFGSDKTRPVTYRELLDMKYLEMVIKEGLRLYPSVPRFSRLLTQDVEYDGITLPKGLILSMAVFTMHRDSNLYPDPEKFDPERFTTDNCAQRHPFAYMPFSAGSRNCIGQKFAMLEMKASISKLLRNFQLMPTEPKHNLHLIGKVTLNSTNGIRMRLVPRN